MSGYHRVYETYKIAVVPLGEKFDVQFMPLNSNFGIRIELCETEHHAIEGAKQFPAFYEIAMEQGFRMGQTGFEHPDGRDIHYSFAMDLDRTAESFKQLLSRNV
jgi:hypothetical protein